MQARYLSLSPYNLVRIILGEKYPSDTDRENVYTRAAACLSAWTSNGILEQEKEPSLFAYYQQFTIPDTGQKVERKSFIGLSDLEDYSAGVVHRHEQTLSGPKKDRMELLRHTRAHVEQIFMLYDDPELAVDKILDQAAASTPAIALKDEYDALHRLWKISNPAAIARIQDLMAGKRLLIADGHHRYETALAFRNENPDLRDARRMAMAFVNMRSPGLEILATHRVVRRLTGFDSVAFLDKIGGRQIESLDELRRIFATPAPGKIRIGIVTRPGAMRLYERDRKPGELDVKVLHAELLGGMLGITEEAVREEKHIEYVRGLDVAYREVREGGAEIAFLLEPTTVEQVSDVAFAGGVMPQKSTDFYPKLLSGLTIYKF